MDADVQADLRLTLKGDGGQISIDVLGYHYPQLDDYWDGNWLDCRVQVSAHGFATRQHIDLRAEDFEGFFEELSYVCTPQEGKAEFQTMEETVSIVVQMSGQGNCLISGNVRVHTKADLSFEIPSDQSFICPALETLQAIVHRFPVKGRPSDA